jgi:glucose-6-phosphate 1-dehydrogenase
MRGDRTLFGSEAGVEAAWRVVNPILKADEPPHGYDGGSWGPAEAERIAAHEGSWIEPSLVTDHSNLKV